MQQSVETRSSQNTIEAAILALSARDQDHASVRNDVGFNGRDTQFGNSLAAQIQARGAGSLSPKQRFFAHKMLRTYRVQLSTYGIDYDAIPTPGDPNAPRPAPETRPQTPARKVDVDAQGKVRFTFAYEPALKDAIKEVGARWEKEQTEALKPLGSNWGPSVWSIFPKPANADALLSIIRRYTFADTGNAVATIEAIRDEAKKRLEGSKASSSDFDVPTMALRPYPFQRAGIEYAVRAKRVLLADQMGLGKTIQALGTLEALDAFPAIIVVPASLKVNWQREARRALPHRSTVVLNGKELQPPVADIYVVNYDVLGRATKPERKGGEWLIEWRPALFALKNREGSLALKSVVFDEFHYVKNYQAQRSRLARELVKGIDVRLGLTGTPVLNRPAEIVEPLTILGRLNDLGGFKSFMTRYCGWDYNGFGYSANGASALKELNDRLRSTCYVRREKSEVLTELPAKRRTRVVLELDNRREYEKAEAELIAWIGETARKDPAKLAEITESVDLDIELGGLPSFMRDAEIENRLQEYVAEKMMKSMSAEALVRFEALKRVAVEGKMRETLEWIENFIEGGEKLVVFATHRDVVKQIAERFGADSITGDTPLDKRQAAVDRFQSDPDARVIVLNIRAGGVGLTLTAASNVAFIELDWNPGTHDQAEDRVHRIGQHDSVTAWYLLAESTIDEEIAELIEDKRAVVDEATTGNATADQSGSILGSLIAKRTGAKKVVG